MHHWPAYEAKRQRCEICPRGVFTYVKCDKCKVFLCFNKDRNCFKAYHM